MCRRKPSGCHPFSPSLIHVFLKLSSSIHLPRRRAGTILGSWLTSSRRLCLLICFRAPVTRTWCLRTILVLFVLHTVENYLDTPRATVSLRVCSLASVNATSFFFLWAPCIVYMNRGTENLECCHAERGKRCNNWVIVHGSFLGYLHVLIAKPVIALLTLTTRFRALFTWVLYYAKYIWDQL